MKRLLIVPILALAATLLAPAAHANHGTAQTPDIEHDSDQRCEVFFVFHASCEVTSEAEGTPITSARVAGVPTADGWNLRFQSRIVDNIDDQVVLNRTHETTFPFTSDYGTGTGAPLPNSYVRGAGMAAFGADSTDVTCLVDVEIGSGRAMRCGIWNSSMGDFLLPAYPGYTPV